MTLASPLNTEHGAVPQGRYGVGRHLDDWRAAGSRIFTPPGLGREDGETSLHVLKLHIKLAGGTTHVSLGWWVPPARYLGGGLGGGRVRKVSDRRRWNRLAHAANGNTEGSLRFGCWTCATWNRVTEAPLGI